MLVLQIIGAVLALGLGLWLGLPGRYRRDLDELERTMVMGTGRTRKAKRHFTPLAWLQRQINVRRSGSRGRGAFKLDRPDDR